MPTNEVAYSVVIPVYNSTHSLVEIVGRLDKVFRDEVGKTHEVILVDDASPNPETWPTLRTLAEEHHTVVAVQLMRNFGKTGAVLCGFEHARGDYVFTLDDDLQHYPEDIPAFIAQQDHDVVIGVFAQKKHGWFKRLTSRIKGWFDHQLIGKPAHIQLGPYKLYKSAVVKSMLRIRTPYPFIPALLFYTTRDVVTVNVRHAERKYGHSDYNFFKRLRTFSNLLINNSAFLLRVVATLGIGVSILSFLLGLFFLLKKLFLGISVPGWTSLMVVTLISNGLVLFSVGIVGEYLVRIINSVEDRPAFIVRETYRKRDQV